MNNERKIRCFVFIAFCIFNGVLFGQKSDLQNVHDILSPASRVSLNGYLAESKLQRAADNRIPGTGRGPVDCAFQAGEQDRNKNAAD